MTIDRQHAKAKQMSFPLLKHLHNCPFWRNSGLAPEVVLDTLCQTQLICFSLQLPKMGPLNSCSK